MLATLAWIVGVWLGLDLVLVGLLWLAAHRRAREWQRYTGSPFRPSSD